MIQSSIQKYVLAEYNDLLFSGFSTPGLSLVSTQITSLKCFFSVPLSFFAYLLSAICSLFFVHFIIPHRHLPSSLAIRHQSRSVACGVCARWASGTDWRNCPPMRGRAWRAMRRYAHSYVLADVFLFLFYFVCVFCYGGMFLL